MTATITLNDQDENTLRVASWGAVSLMSAASVGAAHKASAHGSLALVSATGLVGHVLAKAPKGKDLKGKNIAQIADQVLPALTRAMTVLNEQAPTEADNFRNTVLVAIDAASHAKGQPGPAATEMARKITQALNAA